MFKGLFNLIILIIILSALVSWYIDTQTKQTVIDTVLKTERVVSSDGSESKYLIFGESETYANTDSIWNKKFDSSDIYGHIQTGKTYEFTVVGYRIPLLSYYRNIMSIRELPE